jgi:hypothetical protein
VLAFAVVIALAAVAGLGWVLSAAAREILRRRGIQIDDSGAGDDRIGPRPGQRT